MSVEKETLINFRPSSLYIVSVVYFVLVFRFDFILVICQCVAARRVNKPAPSVTTTHKKNTFKHQFN